MSTPSGKKADDFARRILEDDPADWPDDWDRISAASPPVDPLLDAKILEKIRQSGTIAAPSGFKRWRHLAAAVVLVAGGLGIWFLAGSSESTPALDLRTGAVIGSTGSTGSAGAADGLLKSGSPLLPGDVLAPPARALVYMNSPGMGYRLRGPGRLEYLPREAAPETPAAEHWFSLTAGSLVLSSDSADSVRPAIKTERAVYRLVGTTVRLTVDPDRDVLEVREGAVEVELSPGASRESVTIRAGEVALVSDGSALRRRKLNERENRSLKEVTESLRSRAGAGGNTDVQADSPGLTIEEIRLLHGTVHRLTLKDGREIVGHIAGAGEQLSVITSAGRVQVAQDQLLFIEQR